MTCDTCGPGLGHNRADVPMLAELTIGPDKRNGFADGVAIMRAPASSDAGWYALAHAVLPRLVVGHRSYGQQDNTYRVTFELSPAPRSAAWTPARDG
jgi:hypothetical protein